MWSGSSPLARGLRVDVVVVGGRMGIIPARAGFTRQGRSAPRLSTDHPRSRGVYPAAIGAIGRTPGSSPLARGLHEHHCRARRRRRIIPARAGFTAGDEPLQVCPRDHPRSRGVYHHPGWGLRDGRGSSPLARGLHGCGPSRGWVGGIIPARAGFTFQPAYSSQPHKDHPRSRGVYTCGSLESQRLATLPDRVCLHCRPSARSAELR